MAPARGAARMSNMSKQASRATKIADSVSATGDIGNIADVPGNRMLSLTYELSHTSQVKDRLSKMEKIHGLFFETDKDP
ncbi:hypothetical protein AA0242T_2802 [Acetobacter aceti NRIC 0242]|nr:hypothetical protein AA0242T_2802 [Acetobacter aceti NRIC 0242]